MEPAQKHSVVEGSRSTGMHALRPSQLSHRPSTSMTKAVSELNPSLKPDWNESRESVFFRVLNSCRLTTFSIIFLKKGRRETVVIKDCWVQGCPLEEGGAPRHLFQNWENYPSIKKSQYYSIDQTTVNSLARTQQTGGQADSTESSVHNLRSEMGAQINPLKASIYCVIYYHL